MATRTNNAAESVHAQMNPDVNGVLTLFKFLSIVEEQMNKTNERIRSGCQRETKAVESAKKQLLAFELQKLVSGEQGILNFLDNCGSVVQLKRSADANRLARQSTHPKEDNEWKEANRELVQSAAQALHSRLNPESQAVCDDVLLNVTKWAFQVPPDPDVLNGPSQTRFSLVDDQPRQIFENFRQRVEKECCLTVDIEGQDSDQDDDGPFLMRAPFSFRPEYVEEAMRIREEGQARRERSGEYRCFQNINPPLSKYKPTAFKI